MMNYQGEIQSTSHFLWYGRDICILIGPLPQILGLSGLFPCPLAKAGLETTVYSQGEISEKWSVQGLTNLISIFPQQNRSISPALELLPNVDAKQQEDWNFFLYHTFLTPWATCSNEYTYAAFSEHSNNNDCFLAASSVAVASAQSDMLDLWPSINNTRKEC